MSIESEDIDEETWLNERREQIVAYLAGTGIKHGRIGEGPAWFVFPYVSIWAIESGYARGSVGWWAISGDCPTDYVKCTGDRTPRSAMEQFSVRWYDIAASLAQGKQHPDFTVGKDTNSKELSHLLASRATIFAEWVKDDSVWNDCSPIRKM